MKILMKDKKKSMVKLLKKEYICILKLYFCENVKF